MLKHFSAMILAAGYGKRMLSITDAIPKPLIEINNISLLKNSIDFLFKIGCKKIIINTHYKSNLICDFINEFYSNSNITISYETKLLDTAGGVKNAMKLFDDEDVVVTNCDIYWKKDNEKDVINFINSYNSKDECRLLLVKKEQAFGLINNKGDFSIKNNIVKRWKEDEEIFYYSGLQMISLNILNNINLDKFSFNHVWDYQINKSSLYGNIMFSRLYHVGDKNGLNEAISSDT